jgi:hypothetical protein
VSDPSNVSRLGENVPWTDPFRVAENPIAPVSNALNVPVAPQGLSNSTISNAGVNSNVPVLPARGRISRSTSTEAAVSSRIAPKTTASTVEPGGIARLTTEIVDEAGTVIVPVLSVVLGTPSHPLSPTAVVSSTSHTPPASLLALTGNPLKRPSYITAPGTNVPLSSTEPFKLAPNPGSSVSKTENVPVETHGSPS